MQNDVYQTENLQRFLQQFDDQALANFQAATEDETISFVDPCNCVIGFFNHGAVADVYAEVHRREHQAELEYGYLYHDGRYDLILDLIRSEWARRSLQQTTTTDIGVLDNA